jgi:hypothetical protein
VRDAIVLLRERYVDIFDWTVRQLVKDQWVKKQRRKAEDIRGFLSPSELEFLGNGEPTLYWDDQGEMFGGRSFVTRIGSDGQPYDLEVAR